jgi:hypothetical protein
MQGGHIRKARLEGNGADPEMGRQALHQTVAKQVKLPGIVNQLTEGDHSGVREGWSQRLKISATRGVGTGEWGGVRASPSDEERLA